LQPALQLPPGAWPGGQEAGGDVKGRGGVQRGTLGARWPTALR
jgi:hypothetical protein